MKSAQLGTEVPTPKQHPPSPPPGITVPRGHSEHFHHASAPTLRIPPAGSSLAGGPSLSITPGLATSRQRPASLPKFPVTPPPASGASRPRRHPPAWTPAGGAGGGTLSGPRRQDLGTPPGPGSGPRGRRPHPEPPPAAPAAGSAHAHRAGSPSPTLRGPGQSAAPHLLGGGGGGGWGPAGSAAFRSCPLAEASRCPGTGAQLDWPQRLVTAAPIG